MAKIKFKVVEDAEVHKDPDDVWKAKLVPVDEDLSTCITITVTTKDPFAFIDKTGIPLTKKDSVIASFDKKETQSKLEKP